MSTEVEELYKSNNIDINKISKNATIDQERLRFIIDKKYQNSGFNYYVEAIDLSEYQTYEVEYEILSENMFENKNEALQHIKYLIKLDKLIYSAKKVNIADDNYRPDFNNEDERKYCIAYNHRTKTVTYDFVYTIMVQYTDYRLMFRTQQIAENFISTFREDLIYVNQYKIEKLLK